MGRPMTPEIAYIHNGFAVAYDFCGACYYSGPAGDMPPCEDVETGDTARKMVMRQREPEQSSTWKVIEGDCIEVMRGMEPQSVHCCVTSPPYWGLRDYGTATWKGGLATCDHIEKRQPQSLAKLADKMAPRKNPRNPNRQDDEQINAVQYRGTCKRCGAIRTDSQIGLETAPADYIAKMVDVFCAVRRVLRDDGTLWLVLGDSYAGGGCGSRDPDRWPKQSRNDHMPVHVKSNSGLKKKDLCMIPARVAMALQADGWYLRSDIIWAKPSPMPESVTDRPTQSHDHIFLLSKNGRYWYDADAIKEPTKDWGPRDRTNWKARDERHNTSKPHTGGEKGNFVETGRNKRDVWTVTTLPFTGAHFAVFPPKLIIPCIDAGCPAGGTVFDPFSGAGTTGIVAIDRGRNYVGIELNPEYAEMSRQRINEATRQGRLF